MNNRQINNSLLVTCAVAIGVFLMLGRNTNCEDKPADRLPTDRGSWWQYRGNRRLTGRSLAKGDIKSPAIKWRHQIAGRETLLTVAFQNGEARYPLPTKDVNTVQTDWGRYLGQWCAGASWFDLDGEGDLSAVGFSYNQKVGKILADEPGCQMIVAKAKGYPDVPNVYKGSVWLKTRQNGAWVDKWEIETDTLIWVAEPIFGDFDRDGKMEIALLPWFKLTILDAATGKLKERCNYLAEDQSENPGHGGRAYGWFGAIDLDGDGKDEFVIIEDFIRYASVLGWKDGKLQRLWLKVWEPMIEGVTLPPPDKAVIIRVNPEPVQDIDGDGEKEIVVSAFNLTGDDRWHVLVLNGMTGETKLDLKGKFLTGLRDVDGDGLPELFCTNVERGSRIPEPSNLSILKFRGGALRMLWELRGASFQTYNMPGFPSNVNSGASLPLTTVLCGPIAPDEPSVFFTRKKLDDALGIVELTCWAGMDTQIRSIARMAGPRLEAVATPSTRAKGGSLLLRTTAFEREAAELQISEGTVAATAVIARSIPAPVSPAVVGRPDPNASPVIFVQGANETVEAFRPKPALERSEGADGKTDLVWRVPGRGMTCNNYMEGVLLADLTGDGTLSIVVGARGEGDCARLAALSPKGKTLWHRDFDAYPGTPPPWNVSGLMYWQAGYFTHADRMDLLVQMRRVAGESYLLDGRTGEILWRQWAGRPGRGFGRAWMAMYDYDGDGLEDVLNVYPDMFCVARGLDGKLLVAEEARKFVPGGGYWGAAIVADFLGNGQQQILFQNQETIALLKRQGEMIWNDPQTKRENVIPGIGDADGDGKMDIFVVSAKKEKGSELQCLDATTGALKWKVPVPDGKPTPPAVADIDGDGRDECIFTISSKMYCIGATKKGNAGEVLWTLDLPSYTGPVAIADVEGKGAAQIVVVCANGYVYGIGGASSEEE